MKSINSNIKYIIISSSSIDTIVVGSLKKDFKNLNITYTTSYFFSLKIK